MDVRDLTKRKIIIFNVAMEEALNSLSRVHDIHLRATKNNVVLEDNEISEIEIKLNDKIVSMKEKVGFMGMYVYTTIETNDLQILKNILEDVYRRILTQSNDENIFLLADNIDDFKSNNVELNNSNFIKAISALNQLIKISQLRFIENFSKLMFVTSMLLFVIYITEVILLNMNLIPTIYPKPSFASIVPAFGVVLIFAIMLVFITKYRKKSERNI